MQDSFYMVGNSESNSQQIYKLCYFVRKIILENSWEG